MTTFKLDTSGVVGPMPNQNRFMPAYLYWPDLSPFVQGYVEAMFASGISRQPCAYCGLDHEAHGGCFTGKKPSELGFGLRFSDLAPETLARIMEDCEQFQKPPSDWVVFDENTGRDFWKDRQERQLTRLSSERFPPLPPYLGDDGKIYFKEA